MRPKIIIVVIFAYFNTPVFSQIQKWWESNGAPNAQKQVLQTMPSNLVSRIEKANDTLRVFILNGQGDQILTKFSTGIESNIITADGIDTSGNSILWLSYTKESQNNYQFVIDKFNVGDTVSNRVIYSSLTNSFHHPLGIYCEDHFVYLVLAVYHSDSTSQLKWLKFDLYNEFAVDSFASNSQMNAAYNYAEIKNSRIIVNGSDLNGEKNWLFDIDAKTVIDWQWDFSSSTKWINEINRFTPNNMIFSVVHTSTDSTLTDANLILCDTSLNVQWAINYNSEFNLNDSIVDVAFFKERIYIAGIMQTDTMNQDFVIASLNIDGTLNWELKYDGPGVQVNDLGVSLAVDEVGDIYFTGHSISGDQSNLFSLQLNEFGSVIWEGDLAEAAQKRAVEIVTRNGNVYLSGQKLSTSESNFLIMYRDSLKIEEIQELQMKMLAIGLSAIQDNFQLKRLIWDKFGGQYSFRRTVSLLAMQKFLRLRGYDLFKLMNVAINREYKLDNNSKTVELILSSLKSQKEFPFLHMPFFNNLQETEFVEGLKTVFAYSRDWPVALDGVLPCVECEGPVNVVPCDNCPVIPDMLVVNLEALAMTQINSDMFECPPRNVIRCIYENTGSTSPFISCTYEQSYNIEEVAFDFPGDYEIGIDIPSAGDFEIFEGCTTFEGVSPVRLDFEDEIINGVNEFHIYNPNSNQVAEVFVLEEVGNNRYYIADEGPEGLYRSTCYPIAFASYYGNNNDYNNSNEAFYEFISSITLCGIDNRMGTLGELAGEEIKLAAGGIFKLSPTFTNVPPVYFVQVWGEGIFYTGGPDYSINLNLFKGLGVHCVEGFETEQYANLVQLDRCIPCKPEVQQLFGEPLVEHIRHRLVSYNLDDLRPFWESSNLYLGVKANNNAMVSPTNFIKLPNQSLPSCASNSNSILLCEFNSLEDGAFKFRSAGQNANIPANIPLNIEVVAKFEDGVEINTCFSYTFTGSAGQIFNSLVVFPTGRLKNFLPNSQNYRVRIYQPN